MFFLSHTFEYSSILFFCNTTHNANSHILLFKSRHSKKGTNCTNYGTYVRNNGGNAVSDNAFRKSFFSGENHLFCSGLLL